MRILSWPLAAVLALSSGVVFAQPKIAAKPGTVVEASPVPAARVQAHTFRPAYMTTKKIVTEETPDGPAAIAAKPKAKMKQDAKLNVADFGNDVRTTLSTTTHGYALQLRKNGAVILTQEYNDARSSGEGNVKMTVNTRMHVASLSKLIAAIATVKALDEKNLSLETKIGSYLPAYWTVGQNVADITFKNLLRHRSGFAVPESNSDPCGCRGDYETMKTVVASNVAVAPAGIRYENVNFSLLRVIDPILTGAVPRGSVYQLQAVNAQAVNTANISDVVWDIRTTDAFLAYVQAKVFNPAGVSNVSAAPSGSSGALAYVDKSDTQGWDSGDLATQLGGAGFRLSVKEYLDVMNAYRRKGTIVSTAKAQEAMEARAGLDNVTTTIAGTVYDKNGRWSSDGHTEQCVAFFLPEGMELVVFVNSKLPNSADLRTTIFNAYTNNLD